MVFRSPARIDKNVVSGRERPVEVCLKPIVHAGRLKRNRAIRIAEARHPSRRIVLRRQQTGRSRHHPNKSIRKSHPRLLSAPNTPLPSYVNDNRWVSFRV